MCERLSPKDHPVKRREGWIMCMNARIDGECGPDGKLWNEKIKNKNDKKDK
jgi:hypothetical protein